jgi:hypothetical protein
MNYFFSYEPQHYTYIHLICTWAAIPCSTSRICPFRLCPWVRLSPLPALFYIVSSVLSVAVAQNCDGTVILTSSSAASSPNHHLFSIPWERVNWLFLLSCHAACFCRPIGCLKLFCNFYLSIFGHHSCSPTSLPDYHENHVIWVESRLEVLLEI